VSSRLPADRRSHRQPTNPFACCRVLKKTAHHGGHGTMVGFKEPAHQANPLVSYSQDIVPDSFRRCFTSYSAKKHIVSQMPNHGLCSTMNTIFLPYLNRF